MTTAIDRLNAGTTPGITTGKSNNAVDQTTFLKLLTTQLQNQDPLAPMDNTQMVAQMAQFSSVTGIAEMNASLKGIASDIAASRIGDAASWIGRAALIQNGTATPFADGSYAGEIDVPVAVSNMTLSLVDSRGQTVFSQTLGAQKAGPLEFAWDGRNEAGETIATGPLSVRVAAVDAKGTVPTTISTWVPITGVQSPASGSTKLVTPLGNYSPTEAQRLG